MARWHEVSEDRRYRSANRGQQYWQQPGVLDALLSGHQAGASTSRSEENDGRLGPRADSPAGAGSPGGDGPDHEPATASGYHAEPATAVTAQIDAVDQVPWHRRARIAFREWRRTRPFWAGLLCLLGGALMAYGPLSVFRYVLVAGTVIWAGVLIGLLVGTMGLFLWLVPQYRQIVGILAAVFSVVSLITSNLGGFVLGLLLGSFGGAMGFAWTPLPTDEEQVTRPDSPAPHGQQDAGRQRTPD